MPTMARAYVLVKTKVGNTQETQEALQAIPGVRTADVVAGEYDIIAVVEMPTAQELGQLVMREIHTLPGVASTTTYVVVG